MVEALSVASLPGSPPSRDPLLGDWRSIGERDASFLPAIAGEPDTAPGLRGPRPAWTAGEIQPLRVRRCREPERGALHRVLLRHLQTFLARAGEPAEPGLPAFVRRELYRYLDCGILANAFARMHCTRCGRDELVAFSCKGRGFCPSCCARRMAETAMHFAGWPGRASAPARRGQRRASGVIPGGRAHRWLGAADQLAAYDERLASVARELEIPRHAL